MLCFILMRTASENLSYSPSRTTGLISQMWSKWWPVEYSGTSVCVDSTSVESVQWPVSYMSSVSWTDFLSKNTLCSPLLLTSTLQKKSLQGRRPDDHPALSELGIDFLWIGDWKRGFASVGLIKMFENSAWMATAADAKLHRLAAENKVVSRICRDFMAIFLECVWKVDLNRANLWTYAVWETEQLCESEQCCSL